jgi:hypothetical protein
MKLLVPLLLALFLTACAGNGDNQVNTHLNGFYSSGFSGVSK